MYPLMLLQALKAHGQVFCRCLVPDANTHGPLKQACRCTTQDGITYNIATPNNKHIGQNGLPISPKNAPFKDRTYRGLQVSMLSPSFCVEIKSSAATRCFLHVLIRKRDAHLSDRLPWYSSMS